MSEDTEKIPAKIGPYNIEGLLRKGGMSYLYLATHPDSMEPIAVKVLVPSYLTHPEMVQNFLKEAQIIGLANHPNIIQLYGQGEWEGGLYIAMEFIQGTSLRQYMLQHLISLQHALELVMEISMALCHLHSHGVVHRDLKPENVLITDSGGVKVIDFGISQLLSDRVKNVHGEQTKRLIGTPIYMSPEQKENPESTSYPSDIYSLGIITYELVLGRLSHGHIHLGLMPKKLHKILSKALQPNPEDRYQDVVDFMSDIAAYLNSPVLLKENQEIAPLSALSESLRRAQDKLVPQEAPVWSDMDIGFGCYRNESVPSFYYDFFELPNNAFGVMIGEPSIKGPPGIVYTSNLRGMVRALCKLTQKPEEMATVLNALLIEDPMKQTFAVSYLILLPEEGLLRYISCGCGHAWYLGKEAILASALESEHPVLGVAEKTQFVEVVHSWNPGDEVILYAQTGKEVSVPPDQIIAEVMQYRDKAAQREVDAIIRKAKIALTNHPDGHSLFVMTIRRNGSDQSDQTV